jgi:alpha-beta hydrolase superfamily lysophospholipase
MSLLLDLLIGLLALVGLAAIVIAVMLGRPLKPPPPLASVLDGAMQIDPEGLPELSRFQGRDGTWLACRLYDPVARRKTAPIILLGHGSAGASGQMNTIARSLANAGFMAVSVDFRGHGASGTRGDVAYSGQLDDDLTDLIADLQRKDPDARFAYVGHSSGGGYGLRLAAGALGPNFDRLVLLAPYLGHLAPTVRPSEAARNWASADVPRIIAVGVLARFGIDWPQSLPVLAFATGTGAKKLVTDQYTFRLMTSYAAPDDWESAFRRAKAPIDVIAGADDELMDAEAYRRVLTPLGVRVTLIPGVDHMGVCWRPEAIKAIVAALNG